MKYLNEALNDYFNDNVQIYIMKNKLDSSDLDLYLNDKNFLDMIENKLSKVFSKSEAQSIVTRSMDKETAYKFMAYYILSINPYDTIEQLQEIIKNYLFWSVEDFSDEELDMILKYGKQL